MIQPIKTIEAKCKDCYRCIRSCPVKAISLRNGQAQVVSERCITCGLCVSACPQKAKTLSSRVDDVFAWLSAGLDVVVSLAPSFPGAFIELDPLQVLAGIKAAGFLAVEETAAAAADVAAHYHALFAQGQQSYSISSCCPVIVNMVEQYYPELVPHLVPSVSPMIWHSHRLHDSYTNAKIVFIGPCAGKIQEASRVTGHVDAVLTFGQLRNLWHKLSVKASDLAPAEIHHNLDVPRLYPLSRGILSSSELPADQSADVLSVSGIETCMETFHDLSHGAIDAKFVEALACREGCIGGTEMSCGASLMTRRAAVLKYHQMCTASALAVSPMYNKHQRATPLAYQFSARRPDYAQPSEEAINSILRQIGKEEPEDQRNCGGCGYASCRDKAVATYQGLAELEMCVPYMKAKFESLSHLVVESSMDGVVVVNKDMTIYQFNPSAQRMFNPCALTTKAAHLATFMDPTHFVQVAATGRIFHHRVDYLDLGLVTSQVIYALPEYGLIVGIITDITDEENHKKKTDQKHQASIHRATAVIKNQMKLAQEIASLLGESTAETKATLLDLIVTLTDEDGNNA